MNARARRLAPFAGYLMVALLVVVLSLPSSPDSTDSGAKVIAFFQSHKTSSQVSDFLLAYAAIAAIVYFTALAGFLRSRGSQLLASLTVAGSVIFAAGLCVGAGLNAALADNPRRLSTPAAQAINVLGSNMFAVILFTGLALATTSAGIAMLRTKSLPTALGVVTVIVGVVAGTGFLSWFAFMATGPLTLVIAAYLYKRSERTAEITLPDSVTLGVPAQVTATGKSQAKSTEKSTTRS
jgi:hypothetical protein